MELRGSIKEKLPPSLIIKSANLRLLDLIGQGSSQFYNLNCLNIEIYLQVNLASCTKAIFLTSTIMKK